MKGYVINELHCLSALAFADDFILLVTTKDKAQRLLHHTETYLTNFHATAEKCASSEMRSKKDSSYSDSFGTRTKKMRKSQREFIRF